MGIAAALPWITAGAATTGAGASAYNAFGGGGGGGGGGGHQGGFPSALGVFGMLGGAIKQNELGESINRYYSPGGSMGTMSDTDWDEWGSSLAEQIPWMSEGMIKDIVTKVPGGRYWMSAAQYGEEAANRTRQGLSDSLENIRSGPMKDSYDAAVRGADAAADFPSWLGGTSLAAADTKLKAMIEGGSEAIDQATVDRIMGKVTDDINAQMGHRSRAAIDEAGGRGVASTGQMRQMFAADAGRQRSGAMRDTLVNQQLANKQYEMDLMGMSPEIGGRLGDLQLGGLGELRLANQLAGDLGGRYQGAMTGQENLISGAQAAPPFEELAQLITARDMQQHGEQTGYDQNIINQLMSFGGGMLDMGFGQSQGGQFGGGGGGDPFNAAGQFMQNVPWGQWNQLFNAPGGGSSSSAPTQANTSGYSNLPWK